MKKIDSFVIQINAFITGPNPVTFSKLFPILGFKNCFPGQILNSGVAICFIVLMKSPAKF